MYTYMVHYISCIYTDCLLLLLFYIYARYDLYYLKITFYPYFQQSIQLFTVLPAVAAERPEVTYVFVW